MALAQFADAIGASCDRPRLDFHEAFISTLRKVCAWPSEAARSDEVLEAFWLAIMGYNATPQDFAAWRDFFRDSYGDRPPRETIKAMTLAIVMHPSFLLHR